MGRSQAQRSASGGAGARAGALTTVLACVVMGALLIAGPASAASRGFKVHNESNDTLRLETARHVPTVVCAGGPTQCVKTNYPFQFEGRPDDGAELSPGKVHGWELKYGFNLFGGVQYAANFWYKIAGTDGIVEYTIETYSYTNESSCKVTGTSRYTCTAQGLKLTFKNQ